MTILLPENAGKSGENPRTHKPIGRDPRPVTDPVAFQKELVENRSAYERLRDELREQHAGQYAVIAFGRLIATAATFDQALAALDALDPAPQHMLVSPAERGAKFGVILDL
jgi:hypothetical protein